MVYADLYFYRAAIYEKAGKTREARSDRRQSEKLPKTPARKLTEYGKQVFDGLSKETLGTDSLSPEPEKP